MSKKNLDCRFLIRVKVKEQASKKGGEKGRLGGVKHGSGLPTLVLGLAFDLDTSIHMYIQPCTYNTHFFLFLFFRRCCVWLSPSLSHYHSKSMWLETELCSLQKQQEFHIMYNVEPIFRVRVDSFVQRVVSVLASNKRAKSEFNSRQMKGGLAR